MWNPPPPPKEAQGLKEALGIPTLLGALLIRRGIDTADEARAFLNPSLKGLVDPYSLPDMEWGTRIISEAIGSRTKILVYGDYDADGITGTACLYRFLKDLGAEVGCMVPHRLLDGYGVHKHLIERAVHEGYGCIITVDCGTTDVDPLRYALKSGLSVVVTDHHRVPSDLKVDWPLINPKRLPSEDGLWELSGSSMAFLLAVSIRRFLREKGFFRRRKEPDLKGYLGLITIGMVADRVNLSGNQTRLLVKNGLEELNRSEEFVLTYLKEVSSLDTRRLNTEDIGFRLAPRINAPGRIGDPKVALEALIGDDEKRVRSLVDLMESLNNRRRTMEEELLKEVENEIRVKYREPPPLILCYKEDWHEGILGLVASKVSTNHYRPTLILRSKGGILKGSGRSIPEVDLFELIKTQSHLLLKFGGHSGAVGLSLDLSALDSFEEALSLQLQERLNLTSLAPSPYIDMELDLRELTIEDVEALKRLEPFGDGNPEPTFLCRAVEIAATRVIGGDHLRLILRKGNKIFSAIWFGASPSGDLRGRCVDLIYTPSLDSYKGHFTVDLKVIDLKESKE